MPGIGGVHPSPETKKTRWSATPRSHLVFVVSLLLGLRVERDY
jgi:hypothetical protein